MRNPTIRQMKAGTMGGALYPFGGALSPMGGALYPFGGALSPMGGALSPMGGGRPFAKSMDNMRMKKVYGMPVRYMLYGGGILSGITSGLKKLGKAAAKRAGTAAKSAAKELGNMALEEGAKLATSKITDAKRAASVKASRLPPSLRGPAKKAIKTFATAATDTIGDITGSGIASGLNPLRSGQLRTLNKAAEMGFDKAPTLDRHEITFTRNIVQGKRIAGRGLKKM